MTPVLRPALLITGLLGTTAASGLAVQWMDPATVTQRRGAPLARRATHRALVGRTRSRGAPQRGRFTRADVDGLVEQAWAWYDQNAPQPTVGSQLNLLLACSTVGLFRAVLAAGTERAYAVELVADTTSNVYRIRGWPAKLRARVQPQATVTCRGNTDPVALRFPCKPPGYRATPVGVRHGLGFDMVRCAVATYFREQDAIDRCLSAWCNLYDALGDLVGLHLVRTTPLVAGADRCDFRWYPTRSRP